VSEDISVALARVLLEAGETGIAVDWLEREARIVYEETGQMLDDPELDPEDRRRATLIHERLARMFAGLRELALEEDE
jgi:hypothetical protein